MYSSLFTLYSLLFTLYSSPFTLHPSLFTLVVMTIGDAIKKVVERSDLTEQEAESVLEQIMSGECSDPQIASLL
ncbi:MAG TPA: hypothetical protein VKJ45_02645, partial [Blastocatellia bacterium]|nr:hypothetical protein [Blastocatellia bacterium]